MTENEIATQIVDAALRIHKVVGPGLFESVYQTLLLYELTKRGLRAECQSPIPVTYEGIKIEDGFRCDIIVERKVIIEIKSVEQLAPIHFTQLLT